jgi:hypothetical protein
MQLLTPTDDMFDELDLYLIKFIGGTNGWTNAQQLHQLDNIYGFHLHARNPRHVCSASQLRCWHSSGTSLCASWLHATANLPLTSLTQFPASPFLHLQRTTHSSSHSNTLPRAILGLTSKHQAHLANSGTLTLSAYIKKHFQRHIHASLHNISPASQHGDMLHFLRSRFKHLGFLAADFRPFHSRWSRLPRAAAI